MAGVGFLVPQLRLGLKDTLGSVLNGGKVYTYVAGTTSTSKTAWTDANKTSSAANPIVLDSNGKATIYTDGFYKFVIKDSSDVTQYVWDNLDFENFVSVKDFGAVGDGSTADEVAINTAIDALSSGGTLYFPPGTYKCNDDLIVGVAKLKIVGDGEASKIVLALGKKVKVVAVDDVWMDGLWIDGTQSVSGHTNAALIEAMSANAGVYNSGLKVSNCKFTNAPYFGIIVQHYRNVEIVNNLFDTIFYSACEIMSCDYTNVSGNTIKNIATVTSSPPINSYGIAFSARTANDITGNLSTSSDSNQITNVSSIAGIYPGMLVINSNIPDGTTVISASGSIVVMSAKATGSASGTTIKVTSRPCWYAVCSNNIVQNNPVWTALDTHGGQNISFSGNSISDCFYGITVGTLGDWKTAPKNIDISGNSVKGYNHKDNTRKVTGSGTPATTMTLTDVVSFTIKVGDYLVIGSEARRISSLTSQLVFTVVSEFSSTPSDVCCIVTQEGYSGAGCQITGAEESAGTIRELATGLNVSGNTFTNWGKESESEGCALYVRTVRGANISGNIFQEPNGYAIYAPYDNYGVSICGNTCIDPWSFSKTLPAFLGIEGDDQYFTISGNSIKRGNNSYPYVLKKGIKFIDPHTNQNVVFGENFYDGDASSFIYSAPSHLPLGTEALHPQRWVATAAPTSANRAWNVGDVVFNRTPTKGQPLGWYCTSAGSPGSWVAMPSLGFASVSASYKTTADINISTTPTIVNFDQSIFDDSSRVTTGAFWKYTALFAGKYRISCKVTYGASEAWTQSGYIRLFLYKNGSMFLPLDTYTPLTSGTFRIVSLTGSVVVKLAASDYIDIRTQHAEVTSRKVTYNGIDADETWMSIDCIGDT